MTGGGPLRLLQFQDSLSVVLQPKQSKIFCKKKGKHTTVCGQTHKQKKAVLIFKHLRAAKRLLWLHCNKHSDKYKSTDALERNVCSHSCRRPVCHFILFS